MEIFDADANANSARLVNASTRAFVGTGAAVLIPGISVSGSGNAGLLVRAAGPALAKFGSDELRKEFLAPSIAGDYVACIGVSEPSAGSDVAAIKTTARSDGDDYVITGALRHQAGDYVLVRISRFLMRQTRAEEGVVRMGGDEFLVLLTAPDAQHVESAAHRLKAAAAQGLPNAKMVLDELARRGWVCLVPDYPRFGEYAAADTLEGSGYESGSMRAV